MLCYGGVHDFEKKEMGYSVMVPQNVLVSIERVERVLCPLLYFTFRLFSQSQAFKSQAIKLSVLG